MLTGVEETPTDGGGGARAMLSRVAQLVRQTPGVELSLIHISGDFPAARFFFYSKTPARTGRRWVIEMCIRDSDAAGPRAVSAAFPRHAH